MMHDDEQAIALPLPWQLSIWQGLWQRYQSGCLPHGLLFSGQPGLGKRLLALAFSKALLCSHGHATGRACGRCRSCLLLQAGSHPDFYCLEPQPPSHRIKIEPVRQLINSLQQTTLQGQYKVVIICSVDLMILAASNALLKSLEEPNPNRIFILLTHRFGLIPATIRSRCQIIRFVPPLPTVAQAWLEPYLGQDCRIALQLAAGAPLRALALSKTDQLALYQTLLQSLIDLFVATANPSQVAAMWAKIPTEVLFDGLILCLTELIKWQFQLGADYLLPQSLALVPRLKRKFDLILLYQYLDKLQSIQRELLLAPLNLQLLLEDLAYGFTARTVYS